MAENSILLKNGVAILHEIDDQAKADKVDILIRGNKIAEIAPTIEPVDDVQVVDCTDKLIAPGFVDTHRHMYNIGLRGRHGDDLLHDYLVQGILQASSFDPDEIFWGQLAGCMECINAGTTTVVDHSHMNYSEERPKAAIAATVASGLRSVYGYCFNGRVDSWSPFAMNQSFVAPWAMDALERLSQQAPFGDGRVTLGVAFDGWFLPKEVLQPMFENIKKMGIKHITTHNAPAAPGQASAVEVMESCGILSPSVLLSHANFLSHSDISLVKKRNAYISSTPSVELQMSMGTPACFGNDRDIQSRSSLGIDCHNVILASIPSEMRAALLNGRGCTNAKFLASRKIPTKIYKTVQEAYALGTICGARAIGMENQVGSLAVGKLADIVVFDALSPSMICGAQYDPVTAIVMHSTPGDIIMTIIDGIVRKMDGKLQPVETTSEVQILTGIPKSTFHWSDVAKELLRTSARVQEKVDKTGFAHAKQTAMTMFGMDPSMLVDSI
ncbi:uncharacterized protein Z518_00203 [Rhinocladiella mackenziei CBS 650.93]|uniref:Amidohydrolase-related domain-containing protein n=1 Tax=Rhinocladiella mackenziei CBS 650.93 TaxID=1442369 RepID=A0A0D2JIB0_9EURO|nr:uncharacterized protein Z518_00203 [Rhinocladiella mackenziei CBS 650.93]KIX09125.1 hypothetical protein Z518_00203 [Rhinocladiella mackenziei CBS 650.93]